MSSSSSSPFSPLHLFVGEGRAREYTRRKGEYVARVVLPYTLVLRLSLLVLVPWARGGNMHERTSLVLLLRLSAGFLSS